MAPYNSTLLVKALWQAQTAEDKLDVPLPHDDALNEQMLRLTSHVNL